MISIIVPIYNAEQYLKSCIGSLLRQTEKDLQIILVDDESTDGSYAIAESFAAKDPRILLLQQSHAGQSAARNLGLQHAKGEFIAFVDADDAIEPDWCERHLEAIEGVDYVQSQHPRNKYQFTVVWGRVYRKEAIQGLRFEEGMIYEDILYSVDLWLSGAKCRVIPYTGYHYTDNPDSTTSQPHREAQEKVIHELKKRLKTASLRGKIIIAYTLIRLKLHFLRS